MGKMGKFTVKGLDELHKKLTVMGKSSDEFMEKCIIELALRLYSKVVKRTPVGDYDIYVEVIAKRDSKNHKKGDKYMKAKSTGKMGGTLRRGWSISPITKEGNTFKVQVFNPIEYATYVEYGHRQEPGRYVPALGKQLKQGWVKGQFMMTISAQELEKITPQVIEKKLRKYMQTLG